MTRPPAYALHRPSADPIVVLFTRDLRVHDHPALAEAALTGAPVVPLFVVDDGLRANGFAQLNRVRFLLESLVALDSALRTLGGRLVIRRGDPVREAVTIARATGARALFMSADVSMYAQSRERRLAEASREAGLELRLFPGVTVVPPGVLRPADGDHFRIFTAYWHRWRAEPLRRVAAAPKRIQLPRSLSRGEVPAVRDLDATGPSPRTMAGGESVGRARLAAWCRHGLADYPERRDAPAYDGTSRLSPYLHFGCLSPVEIAHRCADRPGGEEFLRQLCWRDFHHQVTAAFPAIAHKDYRPRGDHWDKDAERLEAWQSGRTGVPLVDAGMRQLAAEGWMHNRARLVTASFLVKDLGLDWRLGAAHFFDLLVDGDIANNAGNWQWIAGTGNDTRPNRVFNPARQAQRFDPDGAYVRRWVPELGSGDYPAAIVDHREAVGARRDRRHA